MKTYDTIIIGAGPAGSTAAKQIASKGYSVFFFDMKKEIGTPLQCGEAITKFSQDNTGIPPQNTWIKQHIKGVKIRWRCIKNRPPLQTTHPTILYQSLSIQIQQTRH
jgi:flavin-dependent dehydrogenase